MSTLVRKPSPITTLLKQCFFCWNSVYHMHSHWQLTIWWFSYGEFYLHSCVATVIISIPPCVCSHTHLSVWVCSYTCFNILQRYTHKKFQKQSYFLNIYDYILLLVYKISMSTYFMYGYIPNVYTITDVQVWSHTLRWIRYVIYDEIHMWE